MRRMIVLALALIPALIGQTVWADDLSGVNRFVCSAIQATICGEGGDCTVDLPSNLNIPQFVEVDVDAKSLSTTAASGLNRTTPIANINRQDGTIFLQGNEMGRGFSWVITEQTGQVTVAIAADGIAVIVFGACTPLAAATKGE